METIKRNIENQFLLTEDGEFNGNHAGDFGFDGIELKVGQTYTASNQGTAITPQSFEVTITWIDGENVHYRRAGEMTVRQTPKDRFIEIVSK